MFSVGEHDTFRHPRGSACIKDDGGIAFGPLNRPEMKVYGCKDIVEGYITIPTDTFRFPDLRKSVNLFELFTIRKRNLGLECSRSHPEFVCERRLARLITTPRP